MLQTLLFQFHSDGFKLKTYCLSTLTNRKIAWDCLWTQSSVQFPFWSRNVASRKENLPQNWNSSFPCSSKFWIDVLLLISFLFSFPCFLCYTCFARKSFSLHRCKMLSVTVFQSLLILYLRKKDKIVHMFYCSKHYFDCHLNWS